MSLTQMINYDTAGNFTFDSNQIQFTSGHAELRLIDNPSQAFTQNYSSSSGFTFDSDNTEFTGGVMRQVDQRPAGATLYASFASTVNANWASGSTTATASGGAAIVGSKLDLTGGGSKNLSFAGAGNITTATQTGAIRFRLTLNYNGSPSANQAFFSFGDSATGKNLIQVSHLTNGNLFLLGSDENGNNIFSNTLINFPGTAGETSELEINWDANQGKVWAFGQGFLFAEIDVSPFNRSSLQDLLVFGDTIQLNSPGADFSLDHVLFFDTVQHTTNYTPTLDYPDTIYFADEITLPAFSYSGLGSIQAFTAATLTDSNAPHYTLNNRYWNGSAWVVSNLSYAQSNTASQVSANITTFPVSDMVSVKVITDAGNSQMSCDLLTLTYTGEIYPQTNPTIVNNSGVEADALLTFASSLSASGSDAVRFIIQVQGIDKYWNGSAWVTSDGTYSQANPVSTISTNITTLDISDGVLVKIKVFLHSGDGSSTPTITSVTLGYDFFVSPPDDPNRCIAYAFLNDMIGLLTPTQTALLIVELPTDQGFIYGDRFIAPYIRKFAVNSNGYVETTDAYLQTPDTTASNAGIVETETLDLSPYKFTIQYTNSDGNQVNLTTEGVQIPNQVSVNLVELLSLG